MDLKRFEEKLRSASLPDLLDSLIIYAKQMDTDLKAYEAVKLIKKAILERSE